MAVKKHGVHFDITAENATDRALRAVEDNLGRVNKAAGAVGRTLQGAFIATAAIAAGKAFATAAIEAEQASKRLDAVLKATGHSAGLTKRELDALADSLAESTQFDDESLRGAQAQLLKFGNIHGETFRQALKLSADLAAFMGTDLATAAQQVGKALTSPKEGTGALEKAIGKFNPAAKQMIENLAEQGRAADAQAAVLDLLRGKIGGTAEALNTGLAQGVNNVKKSWGEMLETIGKTEAVGGNTSKVLVVVDNYLRNIKDTIENGDWVEKALAVAALAGGAGGHRRFNLTPAPAPAINERKGAIRGAPAAMRLDDELTGAPMSERDQKAFKDMLALQEKAREEAKKRRAERLREDEQVARAIVDVEEEAAREAAEAWAFYDKQTIESGEKAAAARAEMWKQVFEQIDAEQEEAIRDGEILLEGLEAEAKRAEEAARALGLTFTSAFEDAILEGKKFSDVLQGLAKDIGRIILRKTVTEPVAEGISAWIKSIDWGGIFNKRAEGGPVEAGVPYMVGERGPELMVPAASGNVVPNAALRSMANAGGGRGVSIGVLNVGGASVEAIRETQRMLAALNASVESRSVAAVLDARRRGGSFAAAFA